MNFTKQFFAFLCLLGMVGITSLSAQTVYSTIKAGEWSNPLVWADGNVPPEPIPAGNTANVNHTVIVLNTFTQQITNNGTINVNNDAQLEMRGTSMLTNNGNINGASTRFAALWLRGTTQVINNGVMTFNAVGNSASPMRCDGGGFLNTSGATLNLVGALLTVTRDNSTFTNAAGGLVEINANAVISISSFTSSNVVFSNAGTINNSGLVSFDAGNQENLVTGVLNLNGNGSFQQSITSTGTTFTNTGTINIAGTGASSRFDIYTGGILESSVGTINLTGGAMGGNGALVIPSLSNEASFIPLDSLGSFTFNLTGNYDGGGEFRTLLSDADPTPNLAATGTADVTQQSLFIDGSMTDPAVGTTITLITATGGVSGPFASTQIPFISSDKEWQVVYGADFVNLEVFAIIQDQDNDGVADDVDNCPTMPNPDQADNDQDNIGDICDTDDDNDGVADDVDNCPLVANSDQADNDQDNIGDPCDPDDDNDGFLDAEDTCPLVANPDQSPSACEGISIQKFVLINATSDQPIPAHDPLVNGAVLNKDNLPAQLNIQAVADPMMVGSVVFSLSGPITASRTEGEQPYALFGDFRGDYNGRNFPVGSYTLTATPYTDGGGNGTAGTPLTINFTVVNQAVCNITSITVSNISACNDQGTSTSFDDTFTADVTISYSNAPSSGTLNLSGDATASISAGFIGSASHTFLGVTMAADGSPISLTATFSANTSCTLTNNNAGTAPAACSNSGCSITSLTASNISTCNDQGTSDPSDDTFTADVTVGFNNPPNTGSLNLSGDGSATIPVSSLSGSNHTFTGVVMSADGGFVNISAVFSDDTNCNLTNTQAGTAPSSCSTAPACLVNSINTSSISACNNQGTSDPADDTFTANVMVSFSNPPSVGNLVLSGDGSASVPVASLSGDSHMFTNVTMSADGGPISLTARFSANTNCTLTNTNTGAAPAACSAPSGIVIDKFVLIDAGSDQPIAAHDPLVDGAVLDKNQLPSQLNIQAVTNPSMVGSVVFSLTGPLNSSRMESSAPYALFGDFNGDYKGKDLPVGSYTLTATPYAGSGGNGTPGPAKTINFTVVSGTTFSTPSGGVVENSIAPVNLKVYPNPASTEVNIDLTTWQDRPAQLRITDLYGRVVYQTAWSSIQERTFRVDLSHLSTGLFIVSLQVADEELLNRRLLLQK